MASAGSVVIGLGGIVVMVLVLRGAVKPFQVKTQVWLLIFSCLGALAGAIFFFTVDQPAFGVTILLAILVSVFMFVRKNRGQP
jgi:hypothetical protein